MSLFKLQMNRLSWANDGERGVIEPWGENGLRVRVVMMGEILDTDFDLLPYGASNAPIINITDGEASITNGRITAKIIRDGWEKIPRISFYNQKGDLLLTELAQHGCLKLKARNFRSLFSCGIILWSFCYAKMPIYHLFSESNKLRIKNE